MLGKTIILLLLFGCTTEPIYYIPIETVYFGRDLEIKTELESKRNDTLTPELKLTELATACVDEMVAKDSLSHKGYWDRALKSGGVTFGECVGINYVTAQSSIAGYLDSERHIAIVLNPIYTHLGYCKKGRYECLLLASYK